MTPRPATAAAAAILAALLPLAAGCGVIDDLRGSGTTTRLTLAALAPDGIVPSQDALRATAGILTDRFAEAGYPEPAVDIEDSRLVVTIEEQVDPDQVEGLLIPGELQFRKVLVSTDDPGGESPGEGGPAQPIWTDVAAELGDDVVTAARDWLDSLSEPVPPATEAPAEVAPFGELTGPKVAVVPARFQFYLPVIGCRQLAARPPGAIRAPEQLMVACDDTTKYLLDEARVEGPDIARASAEPSPQAGGWVTLVEFTPDGQQRWTELTREASEAGGVPLDPAALPDSNRYRGERPVACVAAGGCQVAMMLDHEVISAPQVIDVISGDAQVTGFDEAEATNLASVLQSEPLPLRVELETIDTEVEG